jgi:hypothetical protein
MLYLPIQLKEEMQERPAEGFMIVSEGRGTI